jgi:hypothetical protein
MLAFIAAVSSLAVLPQATATGPDTISATGRGDSTTVDSTRVSGAPRVSLARVTVGIATFAPGGQLGQEKTDSNPTQRRRAVEHSEWYYRRLTIHKAASYATIPLFVTEYLLGDKLYKDEGTSTTKSAHSAVASGIGVLFGVNTVTGVWNLWDSRNDTQGRARRITHAVLMLASDAGFVATAALAPGDDDEFEGGGSDDRDRHRTVAISSMGVSLASYLMMYIWK